MERARDSHATYFEQSKTPASPTDLARPGAFDDRGHPCNRAYLWPRCWIDDITADYTD
jgi:hypothetical protein